MDYLRLGDTLCARRPAILQPVANSIFTRNRLFLFSHTGKPTWALPLRSQSSQSGKAPGTAISEA